MMNIDDEDPKVRRNLITFSSAIVLFAWLELPMKAVTEKLVSASWTAEPMRVWLAIAGALIYLAVRFHFIGGGKEAFRALGDWFQTNLHWQIDAFMRRVEHASVGRGVVRHPLADALDMDMRTLVEQGQIVSSAVRVISAKPQGYQSGKTWQFVGIAEVNLAWFDTSARATAAPLSSKEFAVGYSLPWWQRTWYVLKAAWLSWIFSEQAIAGVVPVWLATTASFIVGLRLGAIWAA
jgi:hypothetical protein